LFIDESRAYHNPLLDTAIKRHTNYWSSPATKSPSASRPWTATSTHLFLAPHHTANFSNVRAYTTAAQDVTAAVKTPFTYTIDNNLTIPSAPDKASSYPESSPKINNTAESDPKSRKFESIQTPVHDTIEYLEAQVPFWRKELWYIAANIRADDPIAQYSIQVDQDMLDWWVGEFSRCRDHGLSRLSMEDMTRSEDDAVDLESSFAEEALQSIKSAEEVVEEQEEDPFWRARLAIRGLQRKVLRLDAITQAEEKLERWKRDNLAQCTRDLYFLTKDIDDPQAAKSDRRLSKVSSEMLKEAVEEFKVKRRRLFKVRSWSEEKEKNKAMRNTEISDNNKRNDEKRKIVDGQNIGESSTTDKHRTRDVQQEINSYDTVTSSETSDLTMKAASVYGNLWKTEASNENEADSAKQSELSSLEPFSAPNSDKTGAEYISSMIDKEETAPQAQVKTGTRLTHLNDASEAHMVNVGGKPPTHRSAVATGMVSFDDPSTYQLIKSAQIVKGDVLSVARIAGIMAAKNCPSLIPLCHPIALTSVEVDVLLLPPSNFSSRKQCGSIEIEARVECVGPTGVEMEALTAVAGASLTVIDMIKAVDRRASIGPSRVVLKKGGRSGDWEDEEWTRVKRAMKKHEDTMARVAHVKKHQL
jgi:molybdenum cofactor biosynthesis protein MoaC